MNSKLISYEEAVKQLKVLEIEQRYGKFLNSNYIGKKWTLSELQSRTSKNAKKINILLSIIVAHKQARRMYGVLRDVQGALGMSSKERKLVDGVLNEKK